MSKEQERTIVDLEPTKTRVGNVTHFLLNESSLIINGTQTDEWYWYIEISFLTNNASNLPVIVKGSVNLFINSDIADSERLVFNSISYKSYDIFLSTYKNRTTSKFVLGSDTVESSLYLYKVNSYTEDLRTDGVFGKVFLRTSPWNFLSETKYLSLPEFLGILSSTMGIFLAIFSSVVAFIYMNKMRDRDRHFKKGDNLVCKVFKKAWSVIGAGHNASTDDDVKSNAEKRKKKERTHGSLAV